MTRRWAVPRLFEGKTVAVLAPGPTMNQKLADTVKHLPRIAVRRAFRFAPDADMVVSIDGQSGTLDDAFWNDVRSFPGLKVTGTESDDVDALYLPIPHEIVTLREGHTVHFRNNGLAAIRIAAAGGAARILLLGFDPERYEQQHADRGFLGLTKGLNALAAELAAKGVEVESVGEGLR